MYASRQFVHPSVLRQESLRVFGIIPAPTCARVNDGGYPGFRLRVDSREPAKPAPADAGAGMTHTRLLHCQSNQQQCL
jgi:hypothetical protein